MNKRKRGRNQLNQALLTDKTFRREYGKLIFNYASNFNKTRLNP